MREGWTDMDSGSFVEGSGGLKGDGGTQVIGDGGSGF